LIILCLLGASCSGAAQKGAGTNNTDAIYFWFTINQRPQGPVVGEGKTNFSVEEEALSTLVFLRRGHVPRATKILQYFADIASRDTDFRGFCRYYNLDGTPASEEIFAANQLWIMLAINYFTQVTGDRTFLGLSKKLAKIIGDMEGDEGGIGTGYYGKEPLAYVNVADNLLASTVFLSYNNLIGNKDDFLSARCQRYLLRYYWDPAMKGFRKIAGKSERDLTENLWGALIFSDLPVEWRDLFAQEDLCARGLEAVILIQRDEKTAYHRALLNLEKNMIVSKRRPDAMGLPALSLGHEIDIAASAWYLFSLEGFNPFAVDTDLLMETNSNYQSHVFLGDDFETNRLKLFLTYPQDMMQLSECRAVVDLETGSNNVASGDGALSISMSPEPGAKSPKVIMARKFLDNQDYSGVTAVRVWAKVVSKVSTYVSQLSIKLSFVDLDGEVYSSPAFTLSGSKGFMNRFSFPVSFLLDGPKHNGVFDTGNISEMRIVITQQGDAPAIIYIDGISFK